MYQMYAVKKLNSLTILTYLTSHETSWELSHKTTKLNEPCNAKFKLYESPILYHLTYCDFVWHFCKALDSRKLERIQERALTAIHKSNAESYERLLRRAKLATLRNRRLQDIATIMHKAKDRLAPSTVSELFDCKNVSYSIR